MECNSCANFNHKRILRIRTKSRFGRDEFSYIYIRLSSPRPRATCVSETRKHFSLIVAHGKNARTHARTYMHVFSRAESNCIVAPRCQTGERASSTSLPLRDPSRADSDRRLTTTTSSHGLPWVAVSTVPLAHLFRRRLPSHPSPTHYPSKI